jgi:hypothetical protein
MQIALRFSTKIDIDFFQRKVHLRLTRLHAYAKFFKPDGWSESRIGIIDTGSPISILPPLIWKSLNVKFLTTEPTLFYGIGEQSGSLRGRLAEVQCLFHDDHNISPSLLLKAHLIDDDIAPILFGFEDILTQADLIVRHRRGEVYLEF